MNESKKYKKRIEKMNVFELLLEIKKIAKEINDIAKAKEILIELENKQETKSE